MHKVCTPKVMLGVRSLSSCLSCKISDSEEDMRLASCPVRGVRRYIEQMQVVYSSDKILSSFPKQAVGCCYLSNVFRIGL